MSRITTRQDKGRPARAADLIATLAGQLPPSSPARGTLKELQALFPKRPEDIREMLERVPGRTLTQKGVVLGVSRAVVWSYWHGKHIPRPDIMARIEAAIEHASSENSEPVAEAS